MKIKYVLLASSLMLSAASFAQKDELKALRKLYDKDDLSSDDISSYKANVNKLGSMSGLAEADQVYLNFYKGVLPLAELQAAMTKNPNDIQAMTKHLSPANINLMANSFNEVLEFEKKSGKEIYTKDIKEMIGGFKPMMLQYAYGLNQASKFKEASQVFAAVYNLDKSDPSNLYNASLLAVQVQDYDNALKYYEELKNINYTGEGTIYYAVNKASGQEEPFGSLADRKKAIGMGTHEKPRDEKIPSKRGEIYKNYASILLEKGRADEAKKAIAEARTLNPDDTDLILAEANLYYEAKDMVTYKKLINEVIAKKPNDPDLYFNLGVVSTNTGEIEEAKKYYEKAIAINPKYFNAYNNLGALCLSGDDKIVKEMNSLGMTPKESKRYDELKAKRQKMFSSAIPYFEKALELEPQNEGVKSILLNCYQVLEMDAKYKALKAKK
ncbi:MAG TPA: tetratricopeptide repeat protein [Flavobacterium sp.]|uniref:tetratricopeptide repeat protein n=1 Tax=Flavobacterium sp. TaxID=239 RepID=UPI002C3E8DB5|nr:tetratricopeptide repeat protein [Flavobacterium sp.]HSD13954.1 tetratricopeptide repeat protein [Flavobacterium sp.]